MAATDTQHLSLEAKLGALADANSIPVDASGKPLAANPVDGRYEPMTEHDILEERIIARSKMTPAERLAADIEMDMDGLRCILEELNGGTAGPNEDSPNASYIVTIMRATAQRLTEYADAIEHPLG